jgi:hypothetical protein
MKPNVFRLGDVADKEAETFYNHLTSKEAKIFDLALNPPYCQTDVICCNYWFIFLDFNSFFMLFKLLKFKITIGSNASGNILKTLNPFLIVKNIKAQIKTSNAPKSIKVITLIDF